ncbi:MAG: hypothetical protein ABIN18_19205 [Pseudomonadota bacterium]
MSKMALHLVYNTGFGRPLTAAKSSDPILINQVAQNSISRAYREAQAISLFDDFAGQVKSEEAARLERVLKTLLPDLESKSDWMGQS